jgi:hypothetical protein
MGITLMAIKAQTKTLGTKNNVYEVGAVKRRIKLTHLAYVLQN